MKLRFKKISLVFLGMLLCGVMALLLCGVMTACGGGGNENSKPSQVDASTISYDGSIINWSAPGGGKATSYIVDVNGTTLTSYAPSMVYQASTYTQSDTFTITIVAKNANGESEPVSRVFTRLPAIDINTVQFNEEGEMSWSVVEGATSYLVRLNGNDVKTATGTSFSEFKYDNSSCKIEIKPVGPDGTFSAWSGSVSKTYLAAPTDIKYDGTTIKWKGYSAARQYALYINDALAATTTVANYIYSSNNDDFTVEVQALGDGVNSFNSKMSGETKFLFLGAIEELRVESGILKWSNEKATSYLVKVNGSQRTLQKPELELVAGSTQRVQIKPLGPDGSNYFSDWSPEESYTILTAPKLQWNDGVTLDGQLGQNLTWSVTDQSTNGSINGFTIEFQTPDGHTEQRTTTETQPYFEYDYKTPGIYKVRVKTNAREDSGYYDSAFTPAAEIIRLDKPQQIDASNFVTSVSTRPTEGFTVKFNSGNVPGATSYALWKNSEKVSDGLTLLSGNTGIKVNRSVVVGDNYRDEQNITFGVQSVGSNAVSQNNGSLRKVLDSLSTDLLEVPIKVLAVPGNLEIPEGGVRVTWGAVSGANGYGVEINDIYTAPNAYYDLDRLSPGTHTVSVCAAGDGHATLASAYSPELTVTKLQTPTGLYVNSGVQEGKIALRNPVQNARSYNLYFNGEKEAVNLDTMDNINTYIRETTVTVIAEAVANYWNINKTEYFLTSDLSESKQFTKLAPVTFPKAPFTDTEFIWNAPSNANNKAISYRVYDNEGYANPYVASAPKQDISTLKPGSYLFSVVALNIGFEDEFINSERVSMEQTVTKLEAPVVTRTKTAYTWEPVDRATAYNVRVGSTLVSEIPTGGELTWIPNFSDDSTFEVTVTAVGDGTTSISTSSEVIRQTVKRLQAPVFTYKYDKECYSVEGRIVFTVDTARSDKNSQAFTYKVNGVVAASADSIKDTTYKYDPGATGKFELTVMAVGKAFGEGEDTTYYLDSPDAQTATLTLLSAPSTSGNNMVLDNSGYFNWSKVDGCYSYKLVVHYADGSSETFTTDASTVKKVGETDTNNPHHYNKITSIEIQALGNGSTVISSQVVTWKK